MNCEDTKILLHALIDGELDAGHAREVEAHIASCAGCAERLREFRAGLIAHTGGSPSLVQLALIDRATVLQHHLTTFDRKAAADGGLSAG